MPSKRTTNRLQIGSRSYQQEASSEHDGEVVKDPILPAAKTGNLTTRTSDSVGTLTMDAGHGIITGDRLDLYWNGGMRYGITVGTVAGDSVPITGGAGDVLPDDESEITAMVPQVEDFVVTAANVEAIGVSLPGDSPAWAVFLTSGDVLVAALPVTSDADYIWDEASGLATPFGANVAKVWLSHGDATASRRVTAQALIS